MKVDAFVVDPRLAQDGIHCLDLPLCQLRLHNDARFVWFVLIPKRSGITEITDLDQEQYDQLWGEVRQVSAALKRAFTPDKINVATLGNQVPQLHVHVIGRFTDDAAWPGPIWGYGTPSPYTPEQATQRCALIQDALHDVKTV